MEDNKQQMFAAYVDVMPLSWNLHVVPQAVICDLYRHIDQYDFVGHMDSDFYFDLNNLADKYGGPLPRVLNESFGYLQYTSLNKNRHVNIGSETQASSKVEQYYTAQSVRRALEYMSIDYVLLGLEVPEWARRMLRDDV